MRKAIIVISGFTEEIYDFTGSRELWEKLIPFEAMAAHDDIIFVSLKKWNYNWEDFAKWLESLDVSDVFVAAYSWGGGFGLRKFSKAFLGRITCVLCDPVYYSKFYSTKWLAVFKWFKPTIRYGDNVTIVKHFKQSITEPGNDRVWTKAPMPKPIDLPYKHTEIDNSDEYHNATIEELKKWLQ